ncbi:hypothetical protein Slin15195_G129340 [Septoria linicola]|uniref:Uncharacterized protein n=1 Tax=Septoria linicola TaxID=215465 RepID=A0A9Q9B2U5_9PEZI|nr:hypothetical protein Slin14017_G121880 [Septoria linicola]USW59615.1 hypothetical protein Slin15195_G129340 [Septoria linicola]
MQRALAADLDWTGAGLDWTGLNWTRSLDWTGLESWRRHPAVATPVAAIGSRESWTPTRLSYPS